MTPKVDGPPGGNPLPLRDGGRSFSPDGILRVLKTCWSAETASRWTPSNPARGQCSVTALAIRNAFGGRLLKTRVDGAWHFYNRIEDAAYDFTASQFPSAIAYDHGPASAEETLADTSAEQVRLLSERLARGLRSLNRT
jgi:hypothetical protein